MRNLSSQMIGLANGNVFPAALFCRIPWQGTVLNVWSGSGPIAFGGTGVNPPTHEWTFDQVGTTIADQWGQDPMTGTNLSWATFPGLGPAAVASFNGSTSTAQVSQADPSINFDGTKPFSVSLWFFNSDLYGEQTLISNLNPSTSNYTGWDISIDAVSGINVYLIDQWTTNCIDVQTPIPSVGAAHHLCVTYDGSKKAAGVAVYLDGALQTPTVAYDSLTGSTSNTNPLHIGSRPDGTQPYDGAIAFAQVYPVAISAASVSALYGMGPAPANTAAAVTFQGVGSLGSISTVTEVSSVSATGVTLTLSGPDPATLQDGLTQLNQGNLAQIWLGAVQNGIVVADPVLIYQGLTDQVTVDVSEKSATVKLSLESRLSDLQREFNHKYTEQWQTQRYPGDNCLNSVEKLVDTQISWH